MENSAVFAKIIGPYMIIVAAGVLFNLKTYQKFMQDFLKNSALIYLGGVIALIIGLLIVLFHNVWAANWPVIITIFGWLGIVKGVWLLILPNTVGKLIEAYQKNIALLAVYLAMILALGIFLTVKGFIG